MSLSMSTSWYLGPQMFTVKSVSGPQSSCGAFSMIGMALSRVGVVHSVFKRTMGMLNIH